MSLVRVSAGYPSAVGNVLLVASATDGKITGILYVPDDEFGNVDYPVSDTQLDWVDFINSLGDLILTYGDAAPSDFWETMERFVIASLTPQQLVDDAPLLVDEHFMSYW